MAFIHAKYDRETERAYVELRDEDDDGGDVLVVAIFSYRTTARLSKAQIEQDIDAQGASHDEARRSGDLTLRASDWRAANQPGHRPVLRPR